MHDNSPRFPAVSCSDCAVFPWSIAAVPSAFLAVVFVPGREAGCIGVNPEPMRVAYSPADTVTVTAITRWIDSGSATGRTSRPARTPEEGGRCSTEETPECGEPATYRGNCFLIALRSVIAECDSAIVIGRKGPEYNSGPTCSSEHIRILLRKYVELFNGSIPWGLRLEYPRHAAFDLSPSLSFYLMTLRIMDHSIAPSPGSPQNGFRDYLARVHAGSVHRLQSLAETGFAASYSINTTPLRLVPA